MRKSQFKKIFIVIVLCTLTTVMGSVNGAVKRISVEGLFKDKAVLMIDGKRRIVRIGDKSPEGVKLLRIRGEKVTLSVNGKQRSYKLGDFQSFTTKFAKPEHVEVTVMSDNNGMYLTPGSINGQSVDFLIDTGATVITLNARAGKRLGINAKRDGQPIIVNTASGVEQAFHVKLKKVSVGGIEFKDISAVVMNGVHPQKILLGMSFLGKVEIQRNGNMMKLKKKW